MKQDNWDDGTPIDRGQDSSARRKARFNQRDAAVCRQAMRVFTTELMDLPGVEMQEVKPAPDATRLRVVICLSAVGTAGQQQQVLARAGRLRAALAASITRRKAPQLSFHFLAGGQAVME